MDLLFVYGTLLPNQSNWHVLAPFVADEGSPDSARGALFDTGLGWPAAVFGPVESRVQGRVFTLAAATLADALTVLDEFEGTHDGAYERIAVATDTGRTAWAYHSGDPGASVHIASGDWVAHVAQTEVAQMNKQNG